MALAFLSSLSIPLLEGLLHLQATAHMQNSRGSKYIFAGPHPGYIILAFGLCFSENNEYLVTN
jgi:hypothetical protein